MAVLSTKFKLVDDMSDKLKNLGTTGKDVEQQLQDIGTSASSLEKVSENAEKSTQAISDTSQAIQEYNEWHEKSVDALTDYINGVEGSEEELNKYIGTTESSSETTEKFNEKLKGSQEEHEKTQEKIKKTSEKTEEYGTTNKEVFENLENLIAAAGIVAFLKQVYDGYQKCIEAASEYETSVAKVSTLADPNQMSVGDMSSELLELSQKTGQAATNLAEAEYQALSAGIATKDAAAFVEKANELAVGGFTEQSTSVDILTTALNAYQLEVSETNRISDVLINTQNKGKTTVDELAQNMGRVIPSAAAYNVEIEDLSTAYAILTANGIATAESTTYLKGMFNELGDTGSTVSETLKEETGKSFAQLKEEGNSLGDIIGVLSNSVNGNATAFANLWSSQEAGIGALSLLTSGTEKYNSVLESMKNSTGTAAEAYEKMTNTSEHTAKAVQTAGTNFQIAVGNAMLPATNKFNEALASVLNGLTTFVNNHPGVVKAVSAIAVGVGVVTAAVVGYTAATKLAKIATTALTAVMDANPFFLVATAITALVAGTIALVASQEDAVDEMDGMSASTKLQHERLKELNEEYDRMCEQGEKNSAEAELLKAQIDELSSSYENSKQSMEDFTNSCRESINAFYDTHNEYYKGVQSINDEEEASGNLITRLEELASKSNLTADEQAEMAAVIDLLNSKMPSLGLSMSEVGNNTQSVIDKLKELSSKQIAESRYENAQKAYNKLLKDQPGLLEKSKLAAQQVTDAQTLYNEKVSATAKAQEEYNEALERYGGDDMSGTVAKYALALSEAGAAEAEALEDYNTAYATFSETKNAYNQNLRDSEDALQEYSDAFAEKNGIIIDSTDEAQQAVSSAAMGIETELQELAAAYDEAYQAALSSIQGQYSLWDEVDDISATSASTLMSNLDSQISYWQNYADNLESLQNRNIEGLDKLLSSIDDGSEESAAALAGMANASDSELQKMVDKFGKLQDEQDRTAGNVADLETDFSDKMDAIAKDAATTIDNMNLSDEATTAATATMNAYISAIKSADVSGAVAAKINEAKSLLNAGTVNIGGSSNVPKHAGGTTNAEDVFIAGEEGPELIVGKAGATVYTAEETEQIINRSFNISPSESNYISKSQSAPDFGSSSSGGSEKVIVLKLEGLGSIRLSGSGGVSKSEVIDILTEQIKPVLVSVLSDEIYEEGEDSYDY